MKDGHSCCPADSSRGCSDRIGYAHSRLPFPVATIIPAAPSAARRVHLRLPAVMRMPRPERRPVSRAMPDQEINYSKWHVAQISGQDFFPLVLRTQQSSPHLIRLLAPSALPELPAERSFLFLNRAYARKLISIRRFQYEADNISTDPGPDGRVMGSNHNPDRTDSAAKSTPATGKCACCDKMASGDAKDAPSCMRTSSDEGDGLLRDMKMDSRCGGKDAKSCTNAKENAWLHAAKTAAAKTKLPRHVRRPQCGKHCENGCCCSKKSEKAANDCCLKPLHS